MAGAMGIDPGPLTLRELVWMNEGRWVHTASVVAAVYSANPNLQKPRIFQADEFNPYRRRLREMALGTARMSAKEIVGTLKRAFLKKKTAAGTAERQEDGGARA